MGGMRPDSLFMLMKKLGASAYLISSGGRNVLLQLLHPQCLFGLEKLDPALFLLVYLILLIAKGKDDKDQKVNHSHVFHPHDNAKIA